MSYKISIELIDKVTKELAKVRSKLASVTTNPYLIEVGLKMDKLQAQLKDLTPTKPKMIDVALKVDMAQIKALKDESITIDVDLMKRNLNSKMKSIKHKVIRITTKVIDKTKSVLKSIKGKTISITAKLKDKASDTISSIKGKTISIVAKLRNTERIKNSLDGIKQKAIELGSVLATLALPLMSFAKFESDFVGLSKLFDDTKEEGRKAIKDIQESILTTSSALSKEDLINMNISIKAGGVNDAKKLIENMLTQEKIIVAFGMDGDVQGATKSLSSLQNTMKKSAKDMLSFSDLVNELSSKVSGAGQDTAKRIIEILSVVTPLAKQMKIPEKHLLTISATASTMAKDVGEATTMTKNLIKDMTSKITSKTLSKLNPVFHDLEEGISGSSKGLDYLFKIMDKLNKVGAKDKNEAINAFFGDEGGQLFRGLIQKREELEQNLKFTKNGSVDGSVEKEYAKIANTISHNWALMQGNLETLMIRLGASWSKMISKIIKGANNVIGVIDGWMKNNKELMSTVGQVILGLSLVIGVLLGVKLAMLAVNASIALLFTPLALLVGGIVLASFYWDELKKGFVDSLGADNIQYLSNLFTSITIKLGNMKDKFFEILGINQSTNESLSLTQQIFEGLGFVIGNAIKGWIFIFEALKEVVVWTLDKFNSLSKAIETSMNKLSNLKNEMVGGVSDAYNDMKSKAINISQSIQSFMGFDDEEESNSKASSNAPKALLGSNTVKLVHQYEMVDNPNFEKVPSFNQNRLLSQSNVKIKNRDN